VNCSELLTKSLAIALERKILTDNVNKDKSITRRIKSKLAPNNNISHKQRRDILVPTGSDLYWTAFCLGQCYQSWFVPRIFGP
jgi:hypothetical protein